LGIERQNIILARKEEHLRVIQCPRKSKVEQRCPKSVTKLVSAVFFGPQRNRGRGFDRIPTQIFASKAC